MKDTFRVVVKDDCICYKDGSNEVLSIRESYSREDGTALMELSGHLPFQMRYELMDEIMLFITCGMKLKLDFSEVSYFSNSCQDVLIEAGNRKSRFKLPGSFELVNVPEDIYNELQHKHYTSLIRTGKKGEKV